MPKDKKKKSEKEIKFFERTWVQAVGAITSIVFLIGVGYSVGIFKGEIDCKVERLEIDELYQAKIEEHKGKCNAIKIGDLDSGINDIDEIIDLLKKVKDEK
ncbi:hypothetical protein [Lacinutrix sp. Bg11-31]|uniref:hypothetical protein n=1 Tax=Lacinutrix sp. Bg11-31 TaxID=2057808 RepID=UPI000C2FF636|nr:hypothetical protein [Lacinutrix sp. Bg11-31]AUC82038.1 hypothetical protein CW733_07840 [Lacinutrix sp. Bg11-31]